MQHRSRTPRQHRTDQDGALSLFAALAMIMLLGFAGLAIDTGRALILKNEMQAAADACALGAAMELNGAPDSPQRASLAGRYLASRNRVSFQSQPVSIPLDEIGFSDSASGSFAPAGAISGSNARYVRCKAEIKSFASALLGAIGIAEFDVDATATAGSLPSQAVCSLPMALCARGADANFGFSLGEAARLTGQANAGQIVYANPGSSTGISQSVLQQAFVSFGICDSNTAAGRCISINTNFLPANLVEDWNSRFGVYKQGGGALSPETATPDLSGFGYSVASGGNYPSYRDVHAPGRTPFQQNFPGYSAIPGVNQNMGAPYRRLAVMPVLACGATSCATGQRPIVGWACVLLITPVTPSGNNFDVEFISRADDPNSPCRAPGTPGGAGSIGPLVPTLVG